MNCLHQFVNALCDKGELRTLVSYPYKDVLTQQDLRPSVISILLSKARSVDLTVRNYYDLLFAFHTVNNDLLSGMCCRISLMDHNTIQYLLTALTCIMSVELQEIAVFSSGFEKSLIDPMITIIHALQKWHVLYVLMHIFELFKEFFVAHVFSC